MRMVIFIGLQASGKSSFYRERFFATHVRVGLDLLRTRHREKRFVELCLETRQPFVIDNTNPTRADRQRYLAPAKAAGFAVAGYYFRSAVEDCKRRNEARVGKAKIPLVGLLGTAARLELPSLGEGFDELHYVTPNDDGFTVEGWRDEVR